MMLLKCTNLLSGSGVCVWCSLVPRPSPSFRRLQYGTVLQATKAGRWPGNEAMFGACMHMHVATLHTVCVLPHSVCIYMWCVHTVCIYIYM